MDFTGLPDGNSENGLDITGLPDTNAAKLRQQYRATTSSPDDAAKVFDITKRTGIPKPVVERNRPHAEKLAVEPDWDSIEAAAPVTARELAANAKLFELAHDDTDNLTQLEKAMRGNGQPVLKASREPETSFGSVVKGQLNVLPFALDRMRQGIRLELADLFGFDTVKQDALRNLDRANFRESLVTPEIQNTAGRWIYGGAANIQRVVPSIAAGIATRSPTVGLVGMGIQVQPETYGKYRARGGTPGEAALGSGVETGIEIGTEMLPMGFLVDRFGKAGAKEFIAGYLGRELPTELVAEISQGAVDTAIANPDKTWGQWADELPDTIGQTVVSTLMLSGGLAAANEAARRLALEQDKANAATQDAAALQNIAQLAAASKLRARDPQTFAEFTAAVTEDGAVQDIYLDPRALQQSGVDLEALAQVSPSVAAQYSEALATGGDIIIPVQEYASSIAGSQLDAVLTPHLRSASDALSLNEAQQFYQTQAEEFRKAATQVMEERAQDTAWQQSAKAVETKLVEQLQGAGRFTPDVNNAYAALMRDFYVTTASRMGMTPEEMYARYPLQVRADRAKGAAVMDQGNQGVREVPIDSLHLNESGQAIARGTWFWNPNYKHKNEAPVQVVRLNSGALHVLDGYHRIEQAQRDSKNTIKVEEVEVSPTIAKMLQNDGVPLADIPQATAEEAPSFLAQALKTVTDALGITQQEQVETIDVDGVARPVQNSNGQRIAQTEEGLRNFWRWFGDSKVVDDQGRPLVVYHGTTADFNAFDPTKQQDGTYGKGFYFSTSESLGKQYGDGKAPIAAYVRAENPYRVDATDFEQRMDQRRPFREKGAQDRLRSAGHDGVVIKDGAYTEVIAFNPTQIKSAVGNQGTFDPQDANILNQSGLDMGQFFQSTAVDQIETPEFKAWAGTDRPVIDSNEINDFDFRQQGPFVMRGFHGTTNVFDEFNASIKGNVGGQFGAVNYFTSSEQDANDNYAGEGPDLTARIDNLRERLEQEFTDAVAEGVNADDIASQINAQYEIDLQALDVPYVDNDTEGEIDPIELAAMVANRVLHGGDEIVMEVFIKTEKPFVVGGDTSPWLEFFDEGDIEAQAVARVADNEGLSVDDVEANRDDYQDQIDDARYEIMDEEGNPLITAVQTVADRYDFDASDLLAELYDVTADGSVRHTNLEKLMRESEALAYAERPDDGARVQSQMIGEIIQELGFDSIILKDANARFKGMNMERGTAHIHVFDANNTNIKSVDNQGTFDPNDPNIYRQPIKGQENNRGEISFGADITKQPSVITLFKTADLSTFLHEMGHFQLEVLAHIASQPNAPAEIVSDMERVLTWFGIKGDEAVVGGEQGGELGQAPKKYPVLSRTLEDYEADPQALIDDIVGLIGEDAPVAVGLRGNYAAEIDKKPRNSWQSPDGVKSYRLPGVSTVGITADWSYAGSRELVQKIPEAIKTLRDYGYGDTDYITVITGTWHRANREGEANDIGEMIISDQNVAGYILRQGDEPTTPDPAALPQRRTALEVWNAMSLEEKRPFHEQFARGFEAYLFEGKAPTPELASLFARFRSWLVNVYKSIKALRVDISDELRGVFDRMVATEDAIREAEALRAYAPLFTGPDQVGDPQLWNDLQSAGTEATQTALDALQKRSLRDMQWLNNARSRLLKQMQRDAKEKRSAVEAEVRAEVEDMPVYKVMRFLRTGEMTAENGDKIKADIGYRLDTDALAEMYPETMLARPALEKLRGMTRKEGLHPDLVAQMFGYTSGDHLVRELVQAEPMAELIEGMTDQRTLERYGDLSSPDVVARAVDEAIHNDARAMFVATELKALTKATGPVRVITKAAKAYAEAMIARKKVRDIKPSQYTTAETRAAKAAQRAFDPLYDPSTAYKTAYTREFNARVKEGLDEATAEALAVAKAQDARDKAQANIDAREGRTPREEAVLQKRNQLVQNYSARAAYDALDEVEKAKQFFDRVVRGKDDVVLKTRDLDIVNAARAILASYGFGMKAKKAGEYLKTVQSYDPETFDILKDRVESAEGAGKPFDFLTLEEMRGLRDEIESLWFLAKRNRQMEVDGDLMDRQDVQAALKARMEEKGIPDTMPGEGSAITPEEERLRKFQTAKAAARRVESWVEAMDGGTAGSFWRYLWNPVKDAVNNYRAEKGKALTALRSAFAEIPGMKRGLIDAPELGYVFGRDEGGVGMSELMHALLHVGNESNKRKLLLGRNWASENADGTLNTAKWDAFLDRMHKEGRITKEHYDARQKIWDILESLKPQAQKAHRTVFGKYFEEVTAEQQTTPFGVYRGGYVPAMADTRIVNDAALRKLAEQENESMTYAFPSTSKGFTKSRTEYNRPLLLDLRTLAQHVDKVLLFSHIEQPIRDVRRVLMSKEVTYGLTRLSPAAYDGLLIPWLNRTARQQVEAPIPGDRGLMRFVSVMRQRAGMAAMFANVSNTVQQVTGLSIAAVKVKPRYLLGAMADYVKNPKAIVRAVAEADPYMATRMDNEVAQMIDGINEILLDPTLFQNAKAWAAKNTYFLQSAVDNVLSPIVWMAAHNQAVDQGLSDADARRIAGGTVRQTQGSTQPEDVSRIETGQAWWRLFAQFAGYFNMQANVLGTAYAQSVEQMGVKKGAGRMLYITLFGFLAPAWVAEGIAQAFRGGPDDEDDDGYLDDWLMAVFGFGTLRNATAMIPVAGQGVNALVNAANSKPYDDRLGTAPAISMLESAVRSPSSVYKAIVDDASKQKAVRDVATLVTLTTGLPVSAVARPLGYGVGVAAGEIDPANEADMVRGLVTGAKGPQN